MKEVELRNHADCWNCKKKIGHTGLPLFWRVTVERFGIDLAAARRQDGLAALLAGHSGLAQVMGRDEDMAKPMMEPVVLTLCEQCAMSDEIGNVAELALLVAETREEPEGLDG